ncbi:MAG: VWA domain-containing protein, partial [Actinomycetia bacterium]|nr:VWA domain-containing protein [Actinomycetes bacterium]
PIPPQKTIDFLAGLQSTELHDVDDIYWVGRVTLVSASKDIKVFDAVFRSWCSRTISVVDTSQARDEESEVERPTATRDENLSEIAMGEGTGRDASSDEILGRRRFDTTSGSARRRCLDISETARRVAPQERTRRLKRSQRGHILDLRRMFASALGNDGEIIDLAYRSAPSRARKFLILIDVSGSLKAHSADFIRFGHAVVRGSDRCEVFTLGTRLTRVTETLRFADVDDSLDALSELVLDIDGGTRIGTALNAFLASSRLRTLASGAEVIVLSDGLEVGSPDSMVAAVERLARVAHRLVWLTPLAGSPNFVPVTKAMIAIRPFLDRIGSSASLGDLEAELEYLAILDRRARRQSPTQRAFCLTHPPRDKT